MTLNEFQALKLWHTRHRERPLERTVWDAVLTLWMMGWVGLPAALLLGGFWSPLVCLSLVFVPGTYVSWRRRMHRSGRLRCDWITALR